MSEIKVKITSSFVYLYGPQIRDYIPIIQKVLSPKYQSDRMNIGGRERRFDRNKVLFFVGCDDLFTVNKPGDFFEIMETFEENYVKEKIDELIEVYNVPIQRYEVSNIMWNGYIERYTIPIDKVTYMINRSIVFGENITEEKLLNLIQKYNKNIQSYYDEILEIIHEFMNVYNTIKMEFYYNILISAIGRQSDKKIYVSEILEVFDDEMYKLIIDGKPDEFKNLFSERAKILYDIFGYQRNIKNTLDLIVNKLYTFSLEYFTPKIYDNIAKNVNGDQRIKKIIKILKENKVNIMKIIITNDIVTIYDTMKKYYPDIKINDVLDLIRIFLGNRTQKILNTIISMNSQRSINRTRKILSESYDRVIRIDMEYFINEIKRLYPNIVYAEKPANKGSKFSGYIVKIESHEKKKKTQTVMILFSNRKFSITNIRYDTVNTVFNILKLMDKRYKIKRTLDTISYV